MRKIYEAEYLKNPDKWDVRFIGFDSDGKPWAMVKKKK
jgi:hypothetical protein